MTLSGIMAITLHYFTKFGRFGGFMSNIKVVKDRPIM